MQREGAEAAESLDACRRGNKASRGGTGDEEMFRGRKRSWKCRLRLRENRGRVERKIKCPSFSSCRSMILFTMIFRYTYDLKEGKMIVSHLLDKQGGGSFEAITQLKHGFHNVVTGGRDGCLRFWDKDYFKEVDSFYDPNRMQINAISVSPSGKFLAVTGEDRLLKLYDLQPGAEKGGSGQPRLIAGKALMRWSTCLHSEHLYLARWTLRRTVQSLANHSVVGLPLFFLHDLDWR